MQTRLFDYDLPEHLIARAPAARRDHSRLMVVNRAKGTVTHAKFADLPHFLPQGARLFRNNATVLRARLRAQRPSGGQVECLLLRPAKAEDGTGSAGSISPWDFICLLKPGRRLKPGETFHRDGHFTATVLDKHPDGENRVRFTPLRGQRSVVEIATLAGDLPLPPYIEQARRADSTAQPPLCTLADNGTLPPLHTTAASENDNERYQTVYADPSRTVAAAAPTAGLHFTPELLASLCAQGIDAHDLTLHVGLDTFRPITAETIEEHQIHRELYEIPAATLTALNPLPHRPRVAVGTTTLRSIEHYFRHRASPQGTLAQNTPPTDLTADANPLRNEQHPLPDSLPGNTSPWIAEADIFIYPPAQFAGVEALITNFHLPRSTLLCLVSAFLTPGSTDGIARLKELYAAAIAHDYRFFSYGDAMLIL